MKKIAAIIVMTFIATGISAQPLMLGLKSGVTILSTDVTSKLDTEYERIKSKDAGFTLAVVSRFTIPVVGIYMQPELVYNYARYDVYGEPNLHSKLTYNNLELPVLFGLNLLFVRINLGPVFNLKTFDGNDNKFHVYHPNIGYIAGFGLSLGKTEFDVRWQGYFSGKNNKFALHQDGQGIKVNEKFVSITFTRFY
ncbi:MAG: hypothetical protein LIO79_09290 [Rikenellaceae bacterium]|nr:hypothetical protein [Rikenellaceae bacterium]